MCYMKRILLLVFVALSIISYIIIILNITFLVFNLNPINNNYDFIEQVYMFKYSY